MHMVYVSWEYPPAFGGGIGTYVYAAAHGLAQRGHRVTVITHTSHPHPVRDRDGRVDVLRIRHTAGGGAEPMASLRAWQTRSDAVADILGKMVDAGDVDAVEFADYRGEGFSFLTGRPSHARPVCIVRFQTPLCVLNKYNPGNVRYRVLEEYENQGILAADRLVSPSQALAREMREALPGLGPIDLSPGAVDPQFLAAGIQRNVPESNEILYVGRLEERKGVETLARAAACLFKQAPGVRLAMVGGDFGAGPGKPVMKNVLLDLVPREYHDRLAFPGPLPRAELLQRYLRARFCVFPSHFENWPNTCLEAMALGRCVIGTDNSGMAEMIQSGQSGVIVRAADVDHLAQAMLELHNLPPARRREMGEAARQRVIERFHPEVVAGELEALYGSYIAAHAANRAAASGQARKASPAAVRDEASPRVAIVIPCYNHGRFLPEALESVRRQTYPHVDCVVVDDGSKDEATLQALARVEAQGVRVIRQPNQGLSAARNTGIAATDAPFFVPLDADDRIAPDFVEKLLAPMLADPTLGYCYSHVEFFGTASGVWQCAAYDARRLLVENLSVATAVVRRAAYDLVRGYSRDMIWGFEDWDFWLALLSVGYVGRCVPEPLFFYRKHGPGKSMLEETQKHRAEMIRVMIEHHRGLFASMLAVSLSDKDAMFFKAHMEAWHLRKGGSAGGPGGASSAAQAGANLDPQLYNALMAQAELDYIESSRSWQTIQRLKRNPLYRAIARFRFGPDWDLVPSDEGPIERLQRIKVSRFYRMLTASKRNRLYLWYARRKYGPEFTLPFESA